MKKYFIADSATTLSAKNEKKQIVENLPIDIVLIGGGIMSATLGTFLKILEPSWTIHMYERLEKIAGESSNGWNNAGTGHSAFCELNYTSITPTGAIDIAKAVAINESFEISRQFWAYLVKKQILTNPNTFINSIPHMSFVWGDDNIRFLRRRFNALQTSTLFRGMVYSENLQQIHEWAPLVTEGRNTFQKVAATRMDIGTDVNFGEITKQLLISLQLHPNFYLYLKHNVVDIKRNADKTWKIHIADGNNNSQHFTVCTRYVFIGGGGASLMLLQKSGIPEVSGYAGFPIGGQFLVTTNPIVTNKHYAKVYGIASIGSPPMSVPHIDTRILDGEKLLLFGPFATLSSRFLKHGSWLDLFHSLTRQNLLPMLHVGLDNFVLIKYLIRQALMSNRDRIRALREYYPHANVADWSLVEAGQRVQIIKKRDVGKGGILLFGTEVVSSADGSLAALLGASPGASISVSITLKILTSMFKKQIASNVWQHKLRELVPSYGQTINGNLALTNEIRRYTSDALKLHFIEVKS